MLRGLSFLQTDRHTIFAGINNTHMRPLLTLPTSEDKTITRGDTWFGFAMKFTQDGLDIDLTGSMMKITFRHPVHTWTLETGAGITYRAATEGKAEVDKINSLQVPAVTYNGDVQVTFPDGTIKTYFDIELTVSDDITK